MNTRDVDVAIIGAGTAGLNARREAEKAGKSFVLIEGGPYGTTCARVGCMPSKLLIAAAESAHHVGQAPMFGIDVDEDGWRVDGRAVMKRVREERDRFVGFVVRSTEKIPDDRRLHGWARFVGPTTLEVGGHTRVEANAIVIATGSSPWLPPQLDGVREHVAVNDDVFDWDDLPDSVAVFGSGVIGLELGQALHRLGVDVQLFNPFVDIGGLQDPVVQKKALEIFGAEMALNLGCEICDVRRESGEFVVEWNAPDGGRNEKAFDVVLAAAGRRPNLDRLELENAGIELDEHGAPADWHPHTTQIGESAIFLAGDAAGYRPILHEASDEGRIAGSNAAQYPDVQRGRRRTALGITFASPNLAYAGARYSELDQSETVIGEVSFDDQGRSRVMGMNAGVMRLYANKDCQLIGAEMVAPRGEHMAHLLAWAIADGLKVNRALARPFYHPVIEEGLRTGLRNVAKKLKLEGRCPPEDFAYGPGQ